MLAADPAGDPVYFVDDHFVPYAGARPVAKGWNTKRRHAGPGRDDTLLVDARGRAVVFGSGEPTGLSTTLPAVLTQLRALIGPDAPVLLGFDRGGAYPVTFTACRDAGADWVTYRRAPLADTTATPRRSWTVRDGKRIDLTLADESVQIKGYGQARQLTLYEAGAPVLQVLTSDTRATGADLLCWLRARWRIENMFKYASEHNGIDALADYRMDIAPDTRMVTNPARLAARKQVKAAAGRARRGRTGAAAATERRRDPETEERRAPRRAPTDPARPSRPGRRAGRTEAHPGQDRRDRAGPRRETSPPAAGPPRPADGAAAARVQRRSVARRAPEHLPGRSRLGVPPLRGSTAPSPATCSTSAGRSSTAPPGSP